MMVEFVFISRPPVDKDAVRAAAVVDAEETDPVASLRLCRLRQTLTAIRFAAATSSPRGAGRGSESR